MRKLAAAVFIAAVLVVAACSERSRDGNLPTGLRRSSHGGTSTLAPCSATIDDLKAQAVLVFGAGSPNVQSVIGKLDNLAKQVAKGATADAQAQAQNIVDFVRQKAGEGRLAGTPEQIDAFINGVLCYAGLPPGTFLIQPTDDPQVVSNGTTDGTSGLSLQGNTVGVPTLLTITITPKDGPSGVNTKLDQYPTFVTITTSSVLTKPAVVAICLGTNVPNSVFNRLRLGHQASAGFEITTTADASFLNCPTLVASASRMPGWFKSLASLVLPRVLYARQDELRSGGVGGSATEFSPFDAVDPELRASGGVGGSATEFQRKPISVPTLIGPAATDTAKQQPLMSLKPRARLSNVSGGSCVAPLEYTVGTDVEALCRPVITVTTAKGTAFTGVPVSWSVLKGAGSITPETVATQACLGTPGASAATTTDVSGMAGVCWTLGPEGGLNEVVGTPSVGGDAPAGTTFNPPSTYFGATGLKITPTATATGESVTFDGLAHPGSGTCTNGLVPSLTYSGDGSVPTNAGSYTLTVTCGAGSNVYNTVTATAAITISGVTPAVNVTCPASVEYTGSAQTPCSATVTGPGLSLTPTPTYTDNTNVGTATATVAYAGGGNYNPASGSATFQITKAASATAVSCPASVVYTGAAQTPCTASVTGVGGLSLAPTPSYANNVNAGTATASYSYAGDANHTGSADSKDFTISRAGSSTTVSCPASVGYTGAALTPCGASVTGVGGLNLSPTPTYSNNVNAGTASASYTFGGDGNHTGSNGSATFQISLASSVTTVSCPVSVLYTGSPQTPCSAVANGAGGLVNQPVPVTYASNVVGTATASATYPGGLNWASSTGSAQFNIFYVQVGCFSSPIYSVMPDTKSAQRKGSNLPVKCSLVTATGVGVLNAHGNLRVDDKGTNPDPGGQGPNIGTLNFPDAFKVSGSGNYAYGLDTGPAFFVSGHFYYVTATWTDGSKTTGWFYIK